MAGRTGACLGTAGFGPGFGPAQQIDFTSTINGKTYRITIAKPYAFPPKGGYPVVYVLDGGAYFGTFAGAARLRSALGAELAPAVIVGISYPSESMLVAQDRRMLDLTHNSPDASRPALGVANKPVETGGANAFYKVIATEIRPRVAAVAPVAQGQDVLFGHSLGGLPHLSGAEPVNLVDGAIRAEG